MQRGIELRIENCRERLSRRIRTWRRIWAGDNQGFNELCKESEANVEDDGTESTMEPFSFMRNMYKYALIFLLVHTSVEQDFSPIADLKTLSELPLEKLLEVKNTLYNNNVKDVENDISSTGVAAATPVSQFAEKSDVDGISRVAEALPVHAKRKGVRRGEYGHDVYHKKSGKKGLQSIFQLSVTTLAFLAFGGYLVCLLVQAFKSKQGVMTATTATTGTGPALLVVRKGHVKRKKPAKFKGPVQPRLRRNAKGDMDVDVDEEDVQVNVWPEADPEAMYRALTMLAEGYSAYQVRDFKHYNATFGARTY